MIRYMQLLAMLGKCKHAKPSSSVCKVCVMLLQAAAAVADAERLQRAAATGEADALRADAERRAKAFNTAVAAAVSRVSASLEADRASLVARQPLPLVSHIMDQKIAIVFTVRFMHRSRYC